MRSKKLKVNCGTFPRARINTGEFAMVNHLQAE
jgi:hypothetical protein